MAAKVAQRYLKILLACASITGFLYMPVATAQVAAAPHSPQAALEDSIRSVLSSQLGQGEYFVYVKVISALAPASGAGEGSLPYSSVHVDKTMLQNLFDDKNGGLDLLALEFEANVVFDERVPEEKRTLLIDVVKDKLKIDDAKHKLTVKTLKLVTPPIQVQATADGKQTPNEAEVMALEKSKLESERAKAALETERAKLELTKQSGELEHAKQELEAMKKDGGKAADPAAKPQTAPGAAAATPPAGALGFLKDFQLLLLAVLFSILGMLGIVLGGSSLRKGFGPLAEAVSKMGGGAPGGGGTTTATASASPPAAVSVASGGGGTTRVETSMAGGQHHAAAPEADGGKGLEIFLTQVQEKLEVLSKEGNFSFYRHFSDMIDQPATLALAASVLVTLEEAATKILLKNLSIEQMAKIKEFLSKPGSLAQAKSLRREALQEFYGKIAVEEFTDSPLAKINDLTWLSAMTAKDMLQFFMSLTGDEQVVLVSCLTPTRAQMLMASCAADDQKRAMIAALKRIESIDERSVAEMLQNLTAKAQAASGDKERAARPLVEGAKYIASIAEKLSREEQEKLFQEVGDNAALLQQIKKYFIPFSTVAAVPKELIAEIFSSRPDVQIAQILFDAGEEVRNAVIQTLPEIKGENVRSELKSLQADKLREKRNQRLSGQLQAEICKYLLSLYNEGLLDLDAAAAAPAAGLKLVGGNGNAA